MFKFKKLLGVVLSGCLVLGMSVPASAAETGFIIKPLVGTPMDYSDQGNWMYSESNGDKSVDLFYIYPTVIDDEKRPDIDDNAIARAIAKLAYGKTGSAFEESCNIFAPYYRQTNLKVAERLNDGKKYEEYLMKEQRTDIYAALDYYFEHWNNDHPFILAGHSQGAALTKIILGEYMQLHPEYLDRMIAAYVIGFSVDSEFLAEHPYLKFASGADDTGVIISWNTEGTGSADAGESLLVEEGAISINPISWRRDAVTASQTESLGSREIDSETKNWKRVPGVADATVNLERGTVVCTTSDDFNDNTELFGPESFHSHDYDFYYYDIQKNAWDRIAAYYSEKSAGLGF